MPIVHKFDYVKPSSIEEVVRVLALPKKCAILNGGTDLIGAIKEGVDTPEVVIDIKGLDELKEISFDGKTLTMGALVSFTDMINSDIVNKHFPVIMETAKTVASVGIRNRATLVGNICSAVPCMDSGTLIIAFDTGIIVEGPEGERCIPGSDFFLKPRQTAIANGEFVKKVNFTLPEIEHGGCWVKLGRYQGEDLAQVNLTVLALKDGTFRVAFGSVGPIPIRAVKIEELLNYHEITAELIEQAKKLIEDTISPITDIRASKEYRMHLSKVMFERGLKTAISRLKHSTPKYGISVI